MIEIPEISRDCEDKTKSSIRVTTSGWLFHLLLKWKIFTWSISSNKYSHQQGSLNTAKSIFPTQMSGGLKSPVCTVQLTGLKSESNTDSLHNIIISNPTITSRLLRRYQPLISSLELLKESRYKGHDGFKFEFEYWAGSTVNWFSQR